MACTTANVARNRNREPSLAAQRSIFSTSRSGRGGTVLISPDIKILDRGGNRVLSDLSEATVSLRASFFSSMTKQYIADSFDSVAAEQSTNKLEYKTAKKAYKERERFMYGAILWEISSAHEFATEESSMFFTYGKSDQHRGASPSSSKDNDIRYIKHIQDEWG